ncbi:hypothetical protein LJY25_13180 [Hymenobacter sp. BT175]|uniref:hypothetical protein n=1 Tax=Hymenobacter translucens TaxID=2886507 RepID=UPI001D0ECE60|nr:hypothetical protein [Hymenobacter translucens]MCC2547402.1 hypothetical protein [Hymenobacter translucens]
MKTSFKSLLVLAAFGAFATTSCGDANNSAENAADNAGTSMENTADNAGAAASNAADNVEADMAREPGDTAVVVNKESDKLVEEVPAKQE